MKLKHIATAAASLLAAFSTAPAFAQRIPVTTKLGAISKEECEMKTYEADTSAAVVILWQKEEVKVDFDLNRGDVYKKGNFTRRIKVLKEEGKSYADDYYLANIKFNENFSRLQVTTYNMENGAVVPTKMNKKDVIRSQYTDNVTKYAYAAPNVKVGSVIEIYYEYESTQYFFIPDYYFQLSVPVNLNEYTIGLPNWLTTNRMQRGCGAIQSERTTENGADLGTYYPGNKLVVDSYRAIDMPAMKKETFCYCPSQYRTAVSYDVTALTLPGAYVDYSRTWGDVVKAINDSEIAKRLKADCKYKDEVDAIMSKDMTEPEKIAAIAELTRGKVEWDGKSSILPKTAAEILKARTGNDADINSLAATAYRRAGFKVTPVFVRGRSSGMLIKQKPAQDSFDSFILKVTSPDGSNEYYIDPSDKLGYVNILCNEFLTDSGFAVEGDEYQWVDLRTLVKNTSTLIVSAAVSSDGTLSGKINCVYSGSEARDEKSFHNKAEKEEDIIEKLEQNFGAEISDYIATGYSEYSNRCQEKMNFTQKCDCTPDMIIVNPFLIEFQSEDSFRAETRDFPVDFDHCFSVNYRLTLNIPEGYVVEQIPSPVRYVSPLPSSTMIQCAQNGTTIQLMYKFDLNTIFAEKEKYQDIKTYWDQICTIYKQKIILKKAN